MKRIEAEWQAYRTIVLPDPCSDIQLRETRKAFYAGACAFFDIQLKAYEMNKEPSIKSIEAMKVLVKEVNDELEEYKQKVTAGVL